MNRFIGWKFWDRKVVELLAESPHVLSEYHHVLGSSREIGFRQHVLRELREIERKK